MGVRGAISRRCVRWRMCACLEDAEETANNGVWQGYENVRGRNFWRSADV